MTSAILEGENGANVLNEEKGLRNKGGLISDFVGIAAYCCRAGNNSIE